MVVLLRALAFAACVLVDLLPSTEVHCRFDAPLCVWSEPAPEAPPAELPPPPPAEPPAS